MVIYQPEISADPEQAAAAESQPSHKQEEIRRHSPLGRLRIVLIFNKVYIVGDAPIIIQWGQQSDQNVSEAHLPYNYQ